MSARTGKQTFVSVARPVNRDAVEIRVTQIDHDERTGWLLAPDGTWREYEGYEVLEPTLSLSGLLLMELRRVGGVEPVLDEFVELLAARIDREPHVVIEVGPSRV